MSFLAFTIGDIMSLKIPERNQRVAITKLNNGYLVTTQQNKGTPGAYYTFVVKPQTEYSISLTGHSKSNAGLWIGDKRKKTLFTKTYTLTPNDKESKHTFFTGNHNQIKVGILLRGTKVGDSFFFSDISIRSTSVKRKTLLFWIPGNANVATTGSSVFTVKAIRFLLKNTNFNIHLLLRYPITNKHAFPSDIRHRVTFLSPRQFGYGHLDENADLLQVMHKLDTKYHYDSIFIRSYILVRNGAIFRLFPGRLHLFIFQDILSDSRTGTAVFLDKLWKISRSFWCSSHAVQEYILAKIKPKNPEKAIYFMPMVDQIIPLERLPVLQSPIRLCYMGSMKKDYFVTESILEFAKIKKVLPQLEYHLYGDVFSKINKRAFVQLCSRTCGVKYHGGITNNKVCSALKSMHFSMCFRSSKYNRYLDLSSKMLESSQLGIVCLINPTRVNSTLYGKEYKGYMTNMKELGSKLQLYIKNPDIYRKDQEISIKAAHRYSYKTHRNMLEKVELLTDT